MIPRLVLLLFVVTIAVGVQAQSLDRAFAEESIRRIADLVEESYVNASAAKDCAQHLRQRVDAGTFLDAAAASAFAASVTEELRTHCKDPHLEVTLRAPPSTSTPARPPEDPNAWMGDLRERNFDFVKCERLAGNVGYLQLNSFPPPELAGATAEAAMGWLANADAIIIDLRWNSGGSGAMVNVLATYFFAEPVLLTTTYRRATNRTTENSTLPRVAGTRMPKTPLYLLTSAATFSAAEAFAAPLQALKRATVVGERTKGGANPGRVRRVNDLFDVFIPVGATRVAVNDTTWEGTGIAPDVVASASEALRVAHRAAVARVIAESADAERKRELQWVAELLKNNVAIAAKDLQRWVGRYETREITFADRALFVSNDRGPRRRLLPITASTFLIEGFEQARYAFEAEALIIERSNGRVERLIRGAVAKAPR